MIPFNDNVRITGNLTVDGAITGAERNSIETELGVAYPLHPQMFRVWDAFQTVLPGTGAADDLGVTTGTFATALPYLSTQDMNAAGAITQRARILFQLPAEYVAGSSFAVNFAAGMVTTVASVSATVDAEVFLSARTRLISGADLITTSATSINSTTFAEYQFTGTGTNLSPGDWLDIRVTIAANSATASSHFAAIAHAEVLLSVQG